MVVDSKGRLFGKVNIIDFCVVLIVVLAATGLVYKVVKGGAQSAADGKTKTVYVTVKAEGVMTEVAKHIKKDDQLINGNVNIDAWIKSIKIEPAIDIVKTQDGKLVAANHPYKKDMTLKIKALVSEDNKSTYTTVGVQPAIVGSGFTVKTKNAYIRGVVIDNKD